MKFQKPSNLSSIRQKIVNGPNYTPVISSSSNLPSVNYRPTPFNDSYSQNLSGKKDLSPAPNTLHRFTLNTNTNIAPNKHNTPEPYMYNQSPIQNKLLNNKIVGYPSSSLNFQNPSPPLQTFSTDLNSIGSKFTQSLNFKE